MPITNRCGAISPMTTNQPEGVLKTKHKTGVAIDSLNSLVMQLTEKASKGLATCRSGDGNPKVVIEFRNLRECQEFYKALVTLWGGYYEIPNEQSALSKTKLEPTNQRTET